MSIARRPRRSPAPNVQSCRARWAQRPSPSPVSGGLQHSETQPRFRDITCRVDEGLLSPMPLASSERSEPTKDCRRPCRSPAPNVQSRRPVAHAVRQLRTFRAGEGFPSPMPLASSERSEPATDYRRPCRSPAPKVQSRQRIAVTHAGRQLRTFRVGESNLENNHIKYRLSNVTSLRQNKMMREAMANDQYDNRGIQN